MVVATIALACMHGLVRYLSDNLNVFVISFYRNVFGLIFYLPIIVGLGLKGMRVQRPMLMLLRCILGLLGMFTWFYGLSKVPTAEATALSFAATVFASLSAFLFLGEKMRLHRWLAIFGGLVGVVVVLQPSSDSFSPPMLWILVSCLFWGASMTTVKLLTRTDSAAAIVAWLSILLTIMSFLPALFNWQWPDPNDLLLLVLMGAMSVTGHFCLTRAMSLGDASAVMSLDFMRLVWATAIGIYFFGDGLNISTWIGACLIFASGIYIIAKESRSDSQRSR